MPLTTPAGAGITEGNFVATSTDFTAPFSATIEYTLAGTMVFLYVLQDFLGTLSGASSIRLDGLPTALRPTIVRSNIPCVVMNNNIQRYASFVWIPGTPTAIFLYPSFTTFNSRPTFPTSGASWSASPNTGLARGFFVQYGL